MEHSVSISNNQKLVQDLKAIILDHLNDEQFGVEELSRKAAMSRSHLHRKLKKQTGLSVSRFIRRVRLEEALKLLQNDTTTVSEVAFKVGFNSASYFSKCFLETYGYSPGDVKKIQGETNEDIFPLKMKEQGATTGRTRAFIALLFAFAVLIPILAFFFSTRTTEKQEIALAVLPFQSLSSDQESQYFADGLVEDLLGRLSVIPDWKVISRTSSDTYRQKENKKISQIASELGVTHIIEGSVQKHGDKVRIAVQLIDAEKDHHLWAKSYDRNLADIFQIQREIATRIAYELNYTLTSQQLAGIRKNGTNNLKAYNYYQLGRFHWNERSKEDFEKAISYFHKAIAEDPNYAVAYANLADTYLLRRNSGSKDQLQGRDLAEEWALKALEIDENLAEAHTVLASVYTKFDRDWAKAEQAYIRALQVNPNYATAHQRYAEHLGITGRPDLARKHIDKALELDPLSYIIRYNSGWQHFSQGRLEQAAAEIDLSLDLAKEHPRSLATGMGIYVALGDDQNALDFCKRYGRATGNFDPVIADSIYSNFGLKALALWFVEGRSPFSKANWYGLLGKNEEALELLEQVSEEGHLSSDFAQLYSFRNLREHPRFIALMNQINLPWSPETSN